MQLLVKGTALIVEEHYGHLNHIEDIHEQQDIQLHP